MENTFPSSFLWGTATAAHQVEGGNVYNDNWVMEHTPGSPYVESSGDACDHYHRYREDITLLADLGFTLYRFSLEWSRIEPEEGEFSLAQLDHYRRMLATCHEHGITPMVTFHHFTSPRWLAASGGWEAQDTLEKFARFCERAMAHLGDLIPLACTLNEVNIGPLISAMTGTPLNAARTERWFEAAARSVGSDASRFTPFLYADAERGRATILAAHRRAVGAVERTQMEYEFWPEALEATIRYASAMTGKPVIVTENGIATDDDTRRIAYIERALRGVAACLRNGIDVRGYTYWSALDNFEWSHGYRPTFGLIAVNRETQERTVKPSARRLGSIARAHGF